MARAARGSRAAARCAPGSTRIATNTCLDAIARRPKRVLPIDYGPARRPPRRARASRSSSRSGSSPTPTSAGLEDGCAAPEARYEQRESVELAFVAALQHLPGDPARRADPARGARLLGARRSPRRSTPRSPSVNSALQRARKTVDERFPTQSQQATLRALGDERAARARRALHGRVGARRRRRGRRDARRGRDLVDAAAADLVPRREAIAGFLRRAPAAASAGATSRRARTASSRSAATCGTRSAAATSRP